MTADRKLRDAFRTHRNNAKRRGVLFLLTFEEWFQIWLASGKLAERGPRQGQYVMARFGDKGAYAVENVRITSVTENHEEFQHTEQEVERIRQRLIGNKLAEGSTFNLGRKHGPKTSAKHRQRMLGNKIMLGKKLSLETRKKQSENIRKALAKRKARLKAQDLHV